MRHSASRVKKIWIRDNVWTWRHSLQHWVICEGNPQVTGMDFSHKGPVMQSFSCWPEQDVVQTVKLLVIWDAMMHMLGHWYVILKGDMPWWMEFEYFLNDTR